MSRRIESSWVVLRSIESWEQDRCVDLFVRPDGSFGFEEFRRDSEDLGDWTPVASYSMLTFPAEVLALEEALIRVRWLDAAIR